MEAQGRRWDLLIQSVTTKTVGVVRFTQGDLAGALGDYDQAICLKPDCPEANNNRGNVHRASGDLSEALEDYNHAIRLKPDFADAYYNRGYARRANNDLIGALKDIEKAISLEDKNYLSGSWRTKHPL